MRELVLDVSKNDVGIDLAAWKRRHGLWGVIIKRGGYEVLDGSSYPEEYHNNTSFANHYANAQAAGLHIGAYYYSIATDPDTMRHNARHLVSLLGGVELDLPVYIDIEEPAQLRLPMEQRAALIDAFCEVIRDAGYIPGVYSGYEGLADIPRSRLSGYAMWVAAWQDSKPKWASDYGMWQQGGMDIDGNIIYGEGDGYHDFDWCYVDYPTQGKGRGGSVARVRANDKAATIHYDMVTDPRNGYTQGDDRWGGNYGGTKTVRGEHWAATYALGDRDCASSVIEAWQLALQGTAYEGALDGATYTGDMEEVFVNSGLFYSELSPAKRGDLYLTARTPYRLGHVAMCQDGGSDGVFGYDCLTEFVRNEDGGAFGGEPGDQDDGESIFRGYYDFQGGWQTVLHYNGKADYTVDDAPKPQQDAGSPMNDFGLTYQAHVQGVGWCDPVRDGQTAGTVGYGKRLEALRFTAIPDGWKMYAKAHVQNVGWVDYGEVDAYEVIGSTGKSQAIEMLILDAKAPSGDKRHLYYRVHQQNVGWKSVTPQGYASGTDGMSLRLEAVRVWLA